jgi:hypothetical protein
MAALNQVLHDSASLNRRTDMVMFQILMNFLNIHDQSNIVQR